MSKQEDVSQQPTADLQDRVRSLQLHIECLDADYGDLAEDSLPLRISRSDFREVMLTLADFRRRLAADQAELMRRGVS
ncbi:MAG: hypothetical protein JWO07_380 [Candidatus Saccharibacteria bacterium]|nr:hypothetical protein [Candidatus Saccharibacteria bacterium]